MIKTRSIFTTVLLILVAAACATPASTSAVIVEPTSQTANLPQTEAEVPRVTPQEAKTALDSGAAIIVDVRSLESYTDMHIQGALSVPLTDIEMNPAGVTLEKNQWIITYCT